MPLSVLYLMKRLLLYPASGNRNYTTGALGETGSVGRYLSSDVSGIGACRFGFTASDVQPSNSLSRAYSFSVRCVQHL